MAEITAHIIQEAYQKAKLVYENLMTQKKAKNDLEKIGLNINSASDLINNLKCMLDGQKYTRTNSAITTECYLENILKDFGQTKLENALYALKQHIEYYEKLQNTNMKTQRKILEKYEKFIDDSEIFLDPSEIINNKQNIVEGAKKQITVNAYERSPQARKECIEHYGITCSICNFNFEEIYGEIGKDFIHVHHLTDISTIGETYNVNPIMDLRPVCPNCHAMLHKQRPAYSIEQIKSLIKKKNL